jgi:hypothetical protein
LSNVIIDKYKHLRRPNKDGDRLSEKYKNISYYSNSFSKEDPNYILGGEYKAALGTIVKEHQIKFVIDLHGASKDREFDMDLGTLHGTSI